MHLCKILIFFVNIFVGMYLGTSQTKAKFKLSKHLFQRRQCDQIGRIFAQWVIVTLGSYLNNTKVSHIFVLGTLFHG
jgi:hypothetical protein